MNYLLFPAIAMDVCQFDSIFQDIFAIPDRFSLGISMSLEAL